MLNRELQIVPLLAPVDAAAGTVTSDSMNMGLLQAIQLLISTGVLTGAGATLQFFAGATNGAQTTEILPRYRLSGASVGTTGSDVYGARIATPAGGIVLTPAASFAQRVITAEITADMMPDGKPWLTMLCSAGSGTVRLMSILAVGIPRYEGDTETTTT